MSSGAKMQRCRYEIKYVVPEAHAVRIRDFVRQYLEPDEFTHPETGAGYPVHSLYLDSPELTLCKQTLSGEKNRFKLRVRFYDDNASSPVFCEVKRRINDVILKQRAGIWRSSLPGLLAGHWPKRADLVKDDDKNFAAVSNFWSLAREVHAGPAAYTSYIREAYEPADSNLYRVTFDRQLKAGEFQGEIGLKNHAQWPAPRIPGVVLELKFTDRMPTWMLELIDEFELQRTSVPKYVECMNLVDQSQARRFADERRIFVDRCLGD